jgi:hypothetical protein
MKNVSAFGLIVHGHILRDSRKQIVIATSLLIRRKWSREPILEIHVTNQNWGLTQVAGDSALPQGKRRILEQIALSKKYFGMARRAPEHTVGRL